MKECLKKLFHFYKKDNNDNLLKLGVITLNTINLFFFIDSPYCVPITLFLILLYVKISKLSYKRKKILVLSWLTFSIFTILGESIIISLRTDTSLNYKNSDIYNVSSWLFSAYASMCLAILYTYDYYETLLS